MKLAEALLLRSDLQKKIEQLQHRIQPVLVINENQSPQEDPMKLLAQLRKAIKDLENLVVKINKTNNETPFVGKENLMEALAERDALKLFSEKLRVIRESAQIHNQSIGAEKLKPTVKLKDIQAEIDQTGRAFRELDTKIQELNWRTELKD